MQHEFSIDLKWSLWSQDQSIFPDGALSTAWDCVTQPDLPAIGGSVGSVNDTCVIYTAPKKEIRYGSVTFSENKATVRFRTEWDKAPDLEIELGVSEGSLSELLPYTSAGEPGIEIECEIDCTEFENLSDLMAAIDQVEADLLSTDAEAWSPFATMKLEDSTV